MGGLSCVRLVFLFVDGLCVPLYPQAETYGVQIKEEGIARVIMYVPVPVRLIHTLKLILTNATVYGVMLQHLILVRVVLIIAAADLFLGLHKITRKI